jgi:dienelactone hydrolase
MNKQLLFLFVFVHLFVKCGFYQEKNTTEKKNESSKEIKLPLKSKKKQFVDLQTLTIEGHKVDIQTPENEIIGNILVLQGWDFPRTDWCQKSDLCKKAIKKGYRLIMPEMGRSVFSSQFYPETLKEWQKFPNKAWIIEKMIPFLQKEKNIFTNQKPNYIVGLSTGGRGVALICLATPNIWTAAASLSGDFDQTLTPQDRLMIGYYGSFEKFPERWKGEDNPTLQAKNFKTPIYLGHSIQDNIVPISQTKVFESALKKYCPRLKIKTNYPKGMHDYKYWNSEVDNMLNFFEEFEKK